MTTDELTIKAISIDLAPLEPKPPSVALERLAYHVELCKFLRQSDPEVWRWFASRRLSPRYAEDTRFELLKSAYRLERETSADLYLAADQVAARLAIAAPLTIYQAQNPAGLNAALAYVPGEVHLVLHGPIATQLSSTELAGLLGHELAHYVLWHDWDGELLNASHMLAALVNDPHSHPAHAATWRLFCLYSEIFCDRAALAVVGELEAAVSTLVKVETGVAEVDPRAYLRQADEIFARGPVSAEGITHPEAFIRARALRLWHEQGRGAEAEIDRMLAGSPALDQLDLLEQRRVAAATRRVLDAILCHKWLQTDVVLAHARLYFDDYAPLADLLLDARLADEVRVQPDSLRDYYCYVLLDVATADRSLEEAPLAAALALAEKLAIKPRFLELVRQELKVRKNQLERIDREKHEIIAEADRTAATAL
jgi:Zn-dependent protease with chaperone function